MSDLDLEAIKARFEAAHTAPWWCEQPPGTRHEHIREIYAERMLVANTTVEAAPFITHARTDIPALVGEVEQLRIEIERLRKSESRAVDISIHLSACLLAVERWLSSQVGEVNDFTLLRNILERAHETPGHLRRRLVNGEVLEP